MKAIASEENTRVNWLIIYLTSLSSRLLRMVRRLPAVLLADSSGFSSSLVLRDAEGDVGLGGASSAPGNWAFKSSSLILTYRCNTDKLHNSYCIYSHIS